MTNKKIMVDGIDVSECDFVFVGKDKKPKIACWCNKLNLICNDNPNCYYKQLKRAEQKLERIAKVCDKFIPDHFKIITILEE